MNRSAAAQQVSAWLAILAGCVEAALLVFADVVMVVAYWFPHLSFTADRPVRRGIGGLLDTYSSPSFVVILAAAVVNLAIAGLLLAAVFDVTGSAVPSTLALLLCSASAGYWSVVGHVPGKVALFTAPCVVAVAACQICRSADLRSAS